MTPDLKTMFPRASRSFIEANTEKPVQVNVERKQPYGETLNNRKLPHPKSQPNKETTLDGTTKRKVESVGRTRVSFIGKRVRPLDPDNFAGSVKDLLDGLRHAHILEGDEPWRITLETSQEKVKSYAEEKTVIEIEFPVHATGAVAR